MLPDIGSTPETRAPGDRNRGDLERFGRWFLNSPVVLQGDRYVAFYDARAIGPVYPEITAYAISMGCVWFRVTGDTRYLERARRCAEFMIRISRPAVPGPQDRRLYLFDTGILATGLVDLCRATGDARFRQEATRLLDWMVRQFDGRSFPATIPEGPGGSREWHHGRSIHLGKLALPLLKGWRLTGGRAYHDAARKLLDWALSLQEPDGRFRIAESERATMTHPHCYVSEALVYAAWALDDNYLRGAVARAADWLASVQNSDGSFYKWYPADPRGSGARRLWSRVVRTKVSDATAQSLRLWRLLDVHAPQAERAKKYLASCERVDGGIPNYVRAVAGFDWRQRRVYSWPTFFWHHATAVTPGDGLRVEDLF